MFTNYATEKVHFDGLKFRFVFVFVFKYSVLVSQLSDRAKSIVRDLDPSNELTYLRIKSKKHEVLVRCHFIYILHFDQFFIYVLHFVHFFHLLHAFEQLNLSSFASILTFV